MMLWFNVDFEYPRAMDEIAIEEAQQRFEELIARVENGETFVIRRGEDLCRLVPHEAPVEADLSL